MLLTSPYVRNSNQTNQIYSHQNGLKKTYSFKSLQRITSISNTHLKYDTNFYYYLVDQMMGTVKPDFQKHLQNLQANYLLTNSEYENMVIPFLEYCDSLCFSLSSKEFAKKCFDLCNLFPIEQNKYDLFAVCCGSLALKVKEGHSQLNPSTIKWHLGGKYTEQEIQEMQNLIQQRITHQDQQSSIDLLQAFFIRNAQWKIYEEVCKQILGFSMSIPESRFVKPQQMTMSVFLACIELKSQSKFRDVMLTLEQQITSLDLVLSLKSRIVQLISQLNSQEIDCVDGSA